MNVEGFCSEFRCRNVRSGVKFTATKSLNAYNGFSIDSNLIYNQSGGNLNVLSGNYSIGNNTSFTMSGNVTITLGNFTVLTGANYRLNSGTLTITNGNVNIERQSTFYQNGTFNITLGNFNLGSRTTYTQYGDMTISRGSFTMGDSVTWAKNNSINQSYGDFKIGVFNNFVVNSGNVLNDGSGDMYIGAKTTFAPNCCTTRTVGRLFFDSTTIINTSASIEVGLGNVQLEKGMRWTCNNQLYIKAGSLIIKGGAYFTQNNNTIILGSLDIDTGAIIGGSTSYYMRGAGTSLYIKSGGKDLKRMQFDGSNGAYTFMDDITLSNDGIFFYGAGNSVNFNGKKINVKRFYQWDGNAFTMNLTGTDTIKVTQEFRLYNSVTFTGNPVIYFSGTDNFTFITLNGKVFNKVYMKAENTGSSSIVFNNNSSAKRVEVLAYGTQTLAFDNVNIENFSLNYLLNTTATVNTTFSNAARIDTFNITSNYGIKTNLITNGGNYLGRVNIPKISQWTIGAGYTQTLVSMSPLVGVCGAEIVVASNSVGTVGNISMATDSLKGDWLKLKDCKAQGGAVFYASNTVDMGNVTGWIINAIPSRNFYWIGGTGNWNDPTHWSFSSGGVSAGCAVPNQTDNVTFDSLSFSAAGQSVTLNVTAEANNFTVGNIIQGARFISGSEMWLYGSLVLNRKMSYELAGNFNFVSSDTVTKTIFTDSVKLKQVYFGRSSGNQNAKWKLLDDFNNNDNYLYQQAGKIITNGKKIRTYSFYSWDGGNKYVDWTGTDTIQVQNQFYTNSNCYWTGTMPVVKFESSTHFYLYGGSHTFGDIIYNGRNAGDQYIEIQQHLVARDITINAYGAQRMTLYHRFTCRDFTFKYFVPTSYNQTIDFQVDNGSVFRNVKILGNGLNRPNVYYRYNYTADSLTFATLNDLYFQGGYTKTIKKYLSATGACDNRYNFRLDNTNTAILADTGVVMRTDWVNMQNLKVQGVGSFIANNALDLGGNTGWTVNQLPTINFYWVGGAGNWSDKSHWATASGGTGGACPVPTQNDNVFFDINSFTAPNQAVTINTTANCLNMIWNNVNNPIINSSADINIYGSMTLDPKLQWNHQGWVYFKSTKLGNTVTTKNVNMYHVNFNGTGEWTLGDNFRNQYDFYVSSGSFVSGGKTMKVGRSFYCWTGNVTKVNLTGTDTIYVTNEFRIYPNNFTLTMGSAVVKFTGTNHFYFTGGNNTYSDLVFNSDNTGNSIINIDYNNTVRNLKINAAGYQTVTLNSASTYNDVTMLFRSPSNNYPTLNVNGNNTFNDFTCSSTGIQGPYAYLNGTNTYNNLNISGVGTRIFMGASQTQTVNGTLALGTGSYPLWIYSTSTGTQATIRKTTGTVCMDFLWVKDINATGGALYFAGGSSTNLGNNTNLSFTSCGGFYWVGGSGNWSDYSRHWARTSGGSILQSNAPTAADDVYFDANSFTTSGEVVTIDIPSPTCRNFSFTSALFNPTLIGNSSSKEMNVYGNIRLITNMSQNFTGNWNFLASNDSNEINTAGQSLQRANFNGGTNGLGGWTLQNNFAVTDSINFNNGTFRANGKEVNCKYFNLATANTRKLDLGSSKININDGAWNPSNTSNLTFVKGTSEIILKGTSNSNFYGNGLTYNKVTFRPTTSMTGTLTGANTYATLRFEGGVNASLEPVIQNATQFEFAGTCLKNIGIESTVAGTQATFRQTTGSVNALFVNLKDNAVTGGATFVAKQSINIGNNSGWSFTSSPALSISLNNGLVNCLRNNDGWAKVNVLQGKSPFTYLWSTSETSDSISGLIPGIYSVTVKDSNGCSATDAISIVNVPSALATVNWNASAYDICQGTTINFTPNEISTSLRFDGSDDYVKADHKSYLNTTNLTVEAWVKADPTQVGYATIVDKGSNTSNGNGWSLQFDGSNGNVRFWNANAVAVSSTTIKDNAWHHVAATFDGSNYKIYVDGALENTVLSSTAPINNDSALFIGNSLAGGTNFKGVLDEVRVWNVARTQTLIQTNRNKDLTGTETGLVAYYSMEYYAGTNVLRDITANANNAKLTNMDSTTAWITPGAVNSTVTYLWNFGDFTTSALKTPSKLYSSPGTYNVSLGTFDKNGCPNYVNKTIRVSQITATVVKNNIPCKGIINGSISITATNGILPYLYSIDNGVTYTSVSNYTGLNIGTYIVKVKDSIGCVSAAQTFTITQPSTSLSFTLSKLGPVCGSSSNATGQITITGVGGTSPYSYSRNDGITYQTSTLFDQLPKGRYTVRVRDANNCINFDSNVVLTDFDTTKPVFTSCPSNISFYADSSCSTSATYSTPTATDNCRTPSVTLSQGLASGSIFPIGVSTVTYIANDSNGNTKTCSFTVTIQDTIKPVVVTQDITVQLNGSGTATITGSQVDNGSSDGCGIASRTVSPSTFNSSKRGTNTVTLTVTDNNGNVKTAYATVTVQDTIKPTAIAQNRTVYLNATGVATITAAQVDNGSTDNCGIATRTLSKSSFDCSNVGLVAVKLYVTDTSGNIDSANAVITVQDTVRPKVVTKNITAQLNALGTVTISASQLDNGSSDSCGIANMTVNTSTFTCSNIGANTVILTVIDNNGNFKTGYATVTIQDTVKPVVITQNITIQLNSSGTASITASQVNNGSNDACGIASMSVSPSSFTVSNAGANTVTLSITDNNGNVKTGTAIVTIQDTIKPTVITRNITVQLDASGNTSITASQVNNGSNDVSGISSISVSPSTFTCSNKGANTVTLTVTDNNSNVSTGTAIVTVQDTISPVVNTNPFVTVYLNANGTANIVSSLFNNGSTDNCGIVSYSTSPSTVSCSDVGLKTITLYATDASGNVGSATATAVVLDPILPVARPKARFTAYLSASGQAIISPALLDSASTDNCTITSIVLSQNAFNCSHVGNNNVVFTVQDQSGNSRSATVIVNVLDTVAPIAIAKNVSVELNSSGTVSITGAQINNGSTDFCGIASYSVSPSTFTCSNIGANTVTLSVTDVNGNVKTATATVTVGDTVVPTVVTRNITVQLDATGNVNLTGAQVNNGSTDACGIATLAVSPSTFTCSNTGANTVTLTVTDNNGNIKTGTAIVTVVDTVRPLVVTQNITVQLNSSGNASITASQINNGSSDACGIATLAVSPSTFTCSNIGANTVTLTVTDNKGNVKTGIATVTVQDLTVPVAIAKNINAYLNASGTVTITGAQVNNNSTDACGSLTYSVSPSTFVCSNTGANTVTLTVTDGSNNSSTATATVTVIDTIVPTVTTQNITVQLNASGNASITASQVNNGSADACGIATLSVSPNTFTCSNVGANTVTLTVTDAKGNSKSGFATVTIQDVTAPVATAKNINAYLNAAGAVSITGAQLNNGSTDACGGLTFAASPNSFTCSNTGANTVTFTATDVNNNSSTASVTVTVIDTIVPTVITQNITVQLNSAGTVSITGAQVNNGSTDACGIASLSVSPSTFTCSNVGANTVILTVTDAKGNSKTGYATVTVQDVTAPVAVAQNINAYLNAAGTVSITGAQINNGSTDACGGLTYSVSPSTFNCSNTGANTVTLTVTDANNNSSTASATVTVIDTIVPTVITQNIAVQLNASGTVSITAAQVNNGSSDACGIATLAVSPSTFTCSNIGANTVTLTVTDSKGNVKTGYATVTVADTVRPIVVTQNITVQLNSLGAATITASQVNNGSSDACGIATTTISPSTFTCSNVGANTVTLTVTDNNGNVKTGIATVTVQDTVRPVVNTQNISVQLNNLGAASITASQINNSSTDACGIATVTVSPNTFTCSNIGTNTVTLTVTDVNGNVNTGTATVTVNDTVRPIAVTQNITVQLDATGNTTITASQINNGSSDACGIATTTVSPSTFTCSNIGANTVTLTVTDNNGNVKTGTATVTVADTVRPVVLTQNISIQLNNSGNASITAAQINNSSSDACGIATVTVSPTSFTCSNVGANTVTLTVTDVNGNVQTGTATVTVNDTVTPVVITKNITVQLDATGNTSIIASDVNNGSNDACGIATLSVSPNTFTCSNTGANTVTLTVTDVNGNVKTGTATVNVQDTVKPIVVTQNISVQLDATGNTSILASQINNGSSDACGIATVTVSPSTFNCTKIGNNTVTLTVTDNKGNVQTGTATVTVFDTVSPVVITKNITVQLDGTGNATIIGSQVNNGSSDACGIASMTVSPNTFNCTNISTPVSVVLTVTDNNGNVNTNTALVTLVDVVKPVVVTKNATIQLNSSGNATLNLSQIENGSTDNCGIATKVLSKTAYNCSNTGSNTVYLIVTDNYGNIDSAAATVLVQDLIKPVAVSQDITLFLNASGTGTVPATDIDNGSTDNCNIATRVLSKSTFNCTNVGFNTVYLIVSDPSGNKDSVTASINVRDTIRPVVVTKNIIAQLDATGNLTILPSQVDNGTYDACNFTLSVLPNTFTCAQAGPNTVVLTARDASNNVSSRVAIVTVQDTVKPVVITRNINAYLNASGNTGLITASQINNGTSDACVITSLLVSPNTYTCSQVGANTITLTATDYNNNVQSGTAIVTVIDTISPTLVSKNISVYLNASGNVSITGSQLNNGSSDNCSIASINVLPNSFTCSNIGANTVTLTLTDVNGNVKTGTATVTVVDTITPIVITQNRTVYLNASGSASVTAAQINNGSTDACGISTISLTPTTFNCLNVGNNTVVLSVTDINNNVRTGTAVVTVIDTVKPVAIAQNITVQLNASGSATITGAQVNNNSTDACGINTSLLSVAPNTFTCSNIGANSVVLTVTDVNGNISTANAIVTVADTVRPVVITKNITVQLNASGSATITGAQVNNNSTDACGINTSLLSVSPSSFTCSNVGSNSVTLTVTDVNGNVKTGIATVTVQDTIKPVVLTQNISIQLSATGNASITAAQINNGSTDACGINNSLLSVSPSSFNCANIGTNSVTLTVIDVNGNIQTGTATVTVSDTVRPVVITRNLSVQLNASGNASITAAQINNGSTDACGINTSVLSVSPSTFTCSNVGSNTVTLTVTDVNGNVKTGTAVVIVIDTIKPVVITKNITAYLSSTGTTSITASQVNNGSTDACGIATLSVSPNTFTCTNVGSNTVTLTVTDVNGNIKTGIAIVTVQDTVKPIVNTRNVSVQLNSSGAASIVAAQINNSSTDSCGIASVTVSPSSFTCSNIGLNTVVLTVTDVNGNIQTGLATVTVNDTVRPVVITQNITVQLNSTGAATITASQINNGSTDACGIATLAVSPNTFTCSNVGANTVTLTVTDVNGNIKTGTAVVTVADTVRPVVLTQNITVQLNSAGTTTITAAQVNNGSTDACGVNTSLLSVSPNTFNCSNTGANTVTLTVTDVNGNIKTGTAIVTVQDTVKPIVITQNISVQLNSLGTASITAAQINNGSNDACGIATTTVSPSTFNCVNLGNNTVTLTVTDTKGNVQTGTAIVTVIDTIKPNVITKNITAYLASNGTYTLTGAQVNNGSTDNCTIATLAVSPSTFTCSNLGANTVTLTVTDLSGNFKTGTAVVTVLDTVRPVVITQNITAQLNSAGTVSITAAQVNNGSTDACGIATLSVSPNSFTCVNTGANTVTLTVTDVNGNIKTGTAIVTVQDTIKPNIIARNITVYLGSAGTVTVLGTQVNGGSTDNCGIATYAVSPATFNCSNIGNNNVVLTVTDTKGNINTASSVITVLDTVRPVVITRNVTAILSATGTVSITASQVNNGSTDACGIATITVSPSSFTCSNIGANTVTLTVTDVNGNIKTGIATVTIRDTIAPIVVTQNRRLYLATNGTVAVTPALIDDGSSDFCGIASMTVSPSILRCTNIGINTVTLTVTDLGGNISTGTAVVTIFDTIKPTVITKNISVYLSSTGTASILGTQINNGSLDACGIATYSASPSTFTCSNTGANTVVLTVTDVNGNFRTANATVTVIDTVRPNVITKNINAYLGSNGTITVLGSQVDNGSSDSCGIASYAVSPNTFTCSNLGANSVVLTVTDTKGNFKTGTATITVFDTVTPVVVTQNITVQLSSLGAASITAAQVNNGSSDACGISTTTVSPNSFTCTNVGNNTVTLTVTDVNGNIKTGTAIVTIQDTVRPVVNTQNITVQLNSLGAASITAAQVNNGSTDICGIATLAVSPNTFNCSNTGNNTVTLTVTDVNGNVKTGTAIVTVQDTVRPVVNTQNITVQLNNLGAASITAAQVNNGSSDACGIATLTVSPNTFTCSNVGTNTVTLTVTDTKGNVKTGTAVVTVLDTVRPIAVAQNITVQLSSLGTASITGAQVNNGSSDACGIATLTVLPNTFNCSNVGNNAVTLTVTDINGNIRTASAVVTIQDTVRPVAVTQNITVQLNSSGAASITGAQVNNGSSDACGISTLAVSPNTFSCSNIGTNTVTLTVTDVNGNIKTGTAVVTVQDTVRPVVITRNITVQLNSIGTTSITGAQVNNGSSDACGIATLAVSPSTFNCSNIGTNTVTLTVTDVNGNVKTGTAVVTVQDTIKPVVITQNITTYLGTNGTVSITAAQINNGSNDACGIASVTVLPTVLSCADLGVKTVTLTVTDVNGNVNSATSTVIVLDPIAPVARPKARYNAYLSINGQVIINAGLLDSASTDNCAITSRVLSQSVFNCSNTGINNILFTVQDQSGNSHSATVAVNILDTIAPNAIVSNQSVYLNAAGTGSITAAQVNNNSTDNCGVATFAISKSNYTCTDLGTNNITFTVTDVNSNTKTANVIVNVFDTIRPTMRPKQNINVYVSATGTANITVSDVDSASTDNCSIATKTLSQTAFTCANVGINTITLNGTDITGNIGSRAFTVTVLDTVRPLLTTRSASIYINSTGSASLTPAQVILSSSDNCSLGLISSINQNNFSCANLGTNTVAVTVTDASGNFRTINATVTVLDTIKPNVLTQNRTIYLNSVGTASLTAAQVNNGTTDNCTIQTLSISKTSYTAADLGINNITFTATDNSSNSQTVNVIVTVLDTVRPIVITQNRTIYLNASGTASLTAAQVNNGSIDNVGVTSILLSRTAFSCSDLGTNLVTLTVSDISNNSASGTATITVLDTIRPVAVARNLTLYLNAIGQVSITPAQINNGSTDNCSIATYTLSKSAFNCSDRGINSNTITLSVIDGSGNISTALANISVLDTIKPNIVVNNNLNIYLNASGVATLTTAQVNNGSNDNCGITALALSKTSFNSTNLGLNIVSFTATDASGNNQSVNVNVNVLDSMMPVAIAQNRIIYLDASGSASVTAAQVNNGSTDNVGVTSISLSKTTFGCSNIGNNAVVLTVRDISNNIATANAIITVFDTIKPTVIAQNLTVYLNGLGLATITPAQVNNGSSDNCSIANLSLSKSSFNCTDRGINSNTLTLSATDASGNISNASFTVSVLDTFKPNVVVNNNLNVYLNASGTATITTAQVNNGSTDNCGITTLTLSKTSFNGSNLGLNIVSFTANDASGNSESVNVNVIVNDTMAPIIIARNKTLYLDASGSAILTANDIDNGSTDNVGITTKTVNKTLFNCNDAGSNLVEFIVGDVSGNKTSLIVTVTVLDTILPVVSNVPANIALGYCKADYNPNMPTATDNCGDVTIKQTAGVTLGNKYPVGVTTNTFTFEDKSGNKVTRSYTVTIYPKYVPDSFTNITVCSSVPSFNLTPINAKGIYTFKGSGVTLDGKMFDPTLSGSGNYNVTYVFVDSMSCVTEGNFFVTVNRAPDKPVIERVTSTVLQVKQQFPFYQWLRYGQPIAGATSQTYNTTRSGLYSVQVSSKEGCSTESDAYAIGSVGVSNTNKQVGFKLYPNPSNGMIYIELDDQSVTETSVKVFDALGKLVYETEINTFITQLDLSNIADGTYFVRLTQAGNTTVKPIVITK